MPSETGDETLPMLTGDDKSAEEFAKGAQTLLQR